MASDTSLIFNLLGKDKISPVLAVVKNAFRSAGRTAEEAMDKATVSTDRLDNQIQETERHLAELNAEFAATGDKTLFGKISRDRSLLSNLRRIRSEVEANNDEVRRSGEVDDDAQGRMRALSSAFSSGISQVAGFGGTVSSSTSSLWGIVGVLGAVAAALVALGPGLALVGGGLGSIPALIGGGIAGIGTLKLGLTGLSSEYQRLTKATGGGGGGGGGATKAAKDFTAANRAVESAVEGVARAERDVRSAQQDALAAQRAINDARETAAKRMRDQALDLKSAQLDQKDSVEAIAVAQADLQRAQASGDPFAIDQATEALQRAQIAAEEAKNKVSDLTEESQKNTKAGVEGSDEVVQAKQREADARQRVADAIQAEHDATERLADSRKALADQEKQGSAGGGGGGGGAGQQITKLAPAARAFLNTIIGLRPAFTALRLDVQEQLFAGLSSRLQTLAEHWLPQLHSTLGAFAGTFNSVTKTLFASAGKKSFIENMAAGADATRKALGEIGQSVAGPLVDAFGRLARASTPFVEKLGHLLAGALNSFSAWIRKADESGKLTSFFQGAASSLDKIWQTGELVVKIFGKFIGIIYPQSKSAGDGVLDGVNKALTKVSNWLDDPKHQQQIRSLISKVGAFSDKLWALGVTGKRAFDWLKGAITGANFAFSHAFAPLVNGFRAAINWIIARWNSLHFSIPTITLPLIGTVGGGSVGVGKIPYLANGGTATRSGMAVVGERGPELISMQRGAQVTPLSRAGGGSTVIVVDPSRGDSDFARAIAKMLRTDSAFRASVKQYVS